MDGRTATALSCHRIIQSWEWGAPCIILSPTNAGQRRTCTRATIHTATPSPSTFVCPRPSVRPSVCVPFFFYFVLFLFLSFLLLLLLSSPSSFIARSALTFCGNSSDSKSVPAARNGFSLLASAFFFSSSSPFLCVDMTGKEKERR
jgi:hypothetical protein